MGYVWRKANDPFVLLSFYPFCHPGLPAKARRAGSRLDIFLGLGFRLRSALTWPANPALKAWFKDVSDAEWGSFKDVQEAFNRASAVGSDRIVFRIRGNHYRLIVRVNFEFSIVYIKFVGTHAEYDKIEADTVDHY